MQKFLHRIMTQQANFPNIVVCTVMRKRMKSQDLGMRYSFFMLVIFQQKRNNFSQLVFEIFVYKNLPSFRVQPDDLFKFSNLYFCMHTSFLVS